MNAERELTKEENYRNVTTEKIKERRGEGFDLNLFGLIFD